MADEDRTADAVRLARAVADFSQYPGAAVHVVAKGSDEWNRFADRAVDAFLDTEGAFEAHAKGLHPGTGDKHSSPVWHARRAAMSAFDRGTGTGSAAEFAVIAEAGDSGLFAVATFALADDALRIVGAGSTHPSLGAAGWADGALPAIEGRHDAVWPAPGRRSDGGLPTAEQLRDTVWYALNRLAAKEDYGLAGRFPSSTGRGPAAQLDQLHVTADEARVLSETTTSELPQQRNPFPAVERMLDARVAVREASVKLRDYLDRGAWVTVQDQGNVHNDLRDRRRPAMLEESSSLNGPFDDHSIPGLALSLSGWAIRSTRRRRSAERGTAGSCCRTGRARAPTATATELSWSWPAGKPPGWVFRSDTRTSGRAPGR